MMQQELSIEQQKSRLSPPALIVGGILAVTGLFLLLPSSRASRAIKARDKLAKEFVGPKDLSKLYGGYLVTDKNQAIKVSTSDFAQILVFAPGPKDGFSAQIFSQLDTTYMYGGYSKVKAVCLLAPEPSCADLSLFAKVWLAMSLQEKTKQRVADALGPSFATTVSPGAITSMRKSAVAQLNSYWVKFPQEVRQQAEDKLEANRKIVAASHGIHRYFQNGQGTNYEIDISQNIWEFLQTYSDAYPNQKMDR